MNYERQPQSPRYSTVSRSQNDLREGRSYARELLLVDATTINSRTPTITQPEQQTLRKSERLIEGLVCIVLCTPVMGMM